MRSSIHAWGAGVLLLLLVGGCGGGQSHPGAFTGWDLIARPGGGVLVIGDANTRHADSDRCDGRLVAVALTSAGRRDTRFAAGGVASRRLSGEDCLASIDQAVGDAAGRVALETTIDHPDRSHTSVAYVLGSRGALTEVPGSDRVGQGSIALEPDGRLALLSNQIFSFPGPGSRAPARKADVRMDTGFGRVIAVQADGRLLAFGLARPERDRRAAIERRRPDLRPDRSWGRDGQTLAIIDPNHPRPVYQPFPYALLATPRGGALAFMSGVTDKRKSGMLLAFDSSGRMDPRFGHGGRLALPIDARDREAIALAARPGGGLYATTATGKRRCRRAILALGPDGRPRRDFGRDGVARLAAGCGITRLAVARDGSLTVLIRAHASGEGARLFKLRRDGSPDPAFGDHGALTLPRLTVAG